MGGFCGYGGSVWVMGEWAVGQWIVGVTSFQKIFGLCGLKCHIMEIWRDVTLEDGRTTDEQRTNNGRNVKIGLEFWKQNSQNFRLEIYREGCWGMQNGCKLLQGRQT